MQTLLNSQLFDNPLLLIGVLWSIPWKGVALWKAARQGEKGWFVALFFINTFALLEILYIFYFSERRKGKKAADAGS